MKSIEILSQNYDEFKGNIHNVGEEFTVSFRASQYNEEGTETNLSENAILALEIQQFPPSLFGLYQSIKKYDNYVDILNTNPVVIPNEAAGVINVTMKVNSAYPGKWALSIKINGVLSFPFLFTTNMPVTALNIISQPTADVMMVARNVGRILPNVYIYIYIY